MTERQLAREMKSQPYEMIDATERHACYRDAAGLWMSAASAADFFEVTPTRLSQWALRQGYPAGTKRYHGGRLFLNVEVIETWLLNSAHRHSGPRPRYLLKLEAAGQLPAHSR